MAANSIGFELQQRGNRLFPIRLDDLSESASEKGKKEH